MRNSRKILFSVFILLVFTAIGCIVGVYLSRPPLLIVTDFSFEALYGAQRLKREGSRLSRMLFRRIVPVYVDENAQPGMISIAVEDTFELPEAVFFPYRYMEGARVYRDDHPDVPVYVLAGANQRLPEETDLAVIRTDIMVDLYRAGLCAALIAGENEVLFINDGSIRDDQLDAFREGLKVQGYIDEPIWGNVYTDYFDNENLSCVVLLSPAEIYLSKNPSVPTLLFSWMDPDFTPRSVKIVFNDSPWSLAPEALKSLPLPGEEVFIGSVPTVLKDRIAEKGVFQKLKGFIKEEFENK